MAAAPFEAPLPSPSVVPGAYNDDLPGPSKPKLPAGPCNFVDLTRGGNGSRCGCRRFWRCGVPGSTHSEGVGSSQAAFCMCSHHACFHDDGQPVQGLGLSQNIPGTLQGKEQIRTARGTLTPVPGPMSLRASPGPGSPPMDFTTLDFGASFDPNSKEGWSLLHRGGVEADADRSLPDTLSWVNFGPSQDGASSLPPIPPQCLLPSQPPSTASSSQVRYLKPFAGKGLETISRIRPRGLLAQEEAGHAVAGQDRPNAGQSPVDVESGVSSPGNLRGILPTSGADAQFTAANEDANREPYRGLSLALQGHERRLDTLENVSFSGAGHEECHERHDHTDLRVTELETRVDEVERRLHEESSTTTSSRPRDDDATSSAISVTTDARARVPPQPDVYGLLEALQGQVGQLQSSALPAYAPPWELEVVFLPFPLRGIWMEPHEFSSQCTPDSRNWDADDWVRLSDAYGRALYPASADRHSGLSNAPWLLPRACAPGRMIDRRLRSRGLVRTIQVRGRDAHSVQTAVSSAFGDMLRAMTAGNALTATGDHRPRSFLGLLQVWIPLRKIHKDSRLRFLTPAEMLTPAVWDVPFLANAAMKATGTQRLYVTHQEAYMQGHRAGSSSSSHTWTWQKVRELSRVYPDSQSSNDAEVPEADALEECWTWDDRVDEQAAAQRRQRGLHHPGRGEGRIRVSPSPSQEGYFSLQPAVPSTSPVVSKAPPPRRKMPRPPHIRTTSMPPLFTNDPSPQGQRKPRVASSTDVRFLDRQTPLSKERASPDTRRSTPSAIAKRRKGPRSPSILRRNTPRWSTVSMSRSPSLGPLGPYRGADDSRGERRTTPFYYATPYSNGAPEYQYARHNTGGVSAADGLLDDMGGINYMDYDGERGSSTDPDDERGVQYGGDVQDVSDELNLDIDVYEDEPDEADEADTHAAGRGEGPWQGLGLHEPRATQPDSPPAAQLPEDEPWPGIEDEMSDLENIDPLSPEAMGVEMDDDEDNSGVSSQPSEYPSTQWAWQLPDGQNNHGSSHSSGGEGDTGLVFKIHED